MIPASRGFTHTVQFGKRGTRKQLLAHRVKSLTPYKLQLVQAGRPESFVSFASEGQRKREESQGFFVEVAEASTVLTVVLLGSAGERIVGGGVAPCRTFRRDTPRFSRAPTEAGTFVAGYLVGRTVQKSKVTAGSSVEGGW